MVRLSTATRHNVVILHQQGLSQTKISKQTGVSKCAVPALLKKTLRIVDAVVSQGNLMQLMKNTSSLFTFEIGRFQAVASAQNWQKPVVPRYRHLLSGEVWPEVVFMEELQPKSSTPTRKQGQVTELSTKT